MDNNNDFFNKWALITGMFQLLDYNLNVKQISNDKLFEELQKQDKVLEYQNQELQKQTNEYLDKIIKQNDEILKILKNNGTF